MNKLILTVITIAILFGVVSYKKQSNKVENLNNTIITTEEQKANTEAELQKTKESDSQNQQKIKELEDKIKQLEAEVQAKAERKRLAEATPAQAPAAVQPASVSSGSIQDIVTAAATKYGLSQALMHRIAKCESNYNAQAINSGYTAGDGSNPTGVFQFIRSTYISFALKAGFPASDDRLDAYSNINVAAWGFANGYASHWECT